MEQRVERDLPELAALLRSEVGPEAFDRPEGSQRRLQPALFASIMCGWKRLGEIAAAGGEPWGEGAEHPVAFAGHSLGELAALVAAEALELQSAVRLVHARGALMERALEGPGRGAMAAFIGPDVHPFAERLTAQSELWLANDNSAVQIVLSGREREVEAAIEEGQRLGLRVVPMPMKGAGHSPLMGECLPPYLEAISRVEFRPPSMPVYSCVTARPFTDPRRELAESVTSTVRFREVLLNLHAGGVCRFIDVGPGHTMAGLAYKTLPDVETLAVSDLVERAGAVATAAGRPQQGTS